MIPQKFSTAVRHRRRLTPRMLALSVLVIAFGWSATFAGTALIADYDPGTPDAIIMLASHEWERLPTTAALARQYPSAIVLLTVPSVVTVFNCHLCPERESLLAAQGVDRSRVRHLRGTANTHGEAVAALWHHRAAPFARLLVVTSPFHTARALATFRAVFAGEAVVVGIIGRGRANPRRWWTDSYDRRYVGYEWAAIVKYRFQHGIFLF